MNVRAIQEEGRFGPENQSEKPRRGLLPNSADVYVRELKTLAFTDVNVRAIKEEGRFGPENLQFTRALALTLE